MNEHALIFVHIPKTGGRSLENILLRRYSKAESLVNVHKDIKSIAAWPDEQKRKIRYIQGHFGYGVHRIFPQRCSYLTMLREPIDRVISHYYFIKRSTGHALHKTIVSENMTLDEYISSGICKEVSNDQVRLIAGMSSDSTDDMLSAAKKHIDEEFILAGLVERFDETLILLKRRLGLRNIFYGVRNQTIGRPLKDQLPDSTLQLIAEHNRADIELYNDAKLKFENAIRDEGPSFHSEMRKFRRFNQPYSKIFHFVRKAKNRIVRGQ